MSDNRPVVVIDSGVGGLAYSAAFLKQNRGERVVYIADSAHFPYGQKQPEAVRGRVRSILGASRERFDPKFVVLACNTASVVALDAARATVTCPVVGVVPAVKPAAEATRSKHIAILATNRTVADPYTEDLIRSHAGDCRITRIGLPEVVEAVEQDYCSSGWPQTTEVLAKHFTNRIPPDVDQIVLACTHFLHVRQIIGSYLPSDAVLVDSVDGVVRRMEWVLDSYDMRCATAEERPESILSTAILPEHLSCLDAVSWDIPQAEYAAKRGSPNGTYTDRNYGT